MKDNQIKQHIVSAIITIIIITVMTILSEVKVPFKNWLQSMFYHHWIGKGVLALAIFFIFAHLIKLNPKKDSAYLTNALVTITIICALAIIIFFAWETFK